MLPSVRVPWLLSAVMVLSAWGAAGVNFLDTRVSAAEPEQRLPVPFDLEAVSQPPKVFETEEHAAEGVRAFFYEGESYRGKPTRVFAYAGLPTLTPGTKVPAMVLIHGGGGTAFDRWVKVWTARGYAAIAMDLCGCVPEGTYGKWKRHAAGGPPGWDASFGQIDEPIGDHWQWHAVSAVLRAHSLLRSYPEVDADRIGVTGISWGGYLTGLVAGVDSRFRFAAPVYGCGFLGDNSAWLPAFEKLGKEKGTRWLDLWDPSHYLPHARMPLLWVNGTNDFAYPMDSWQKSYRLPPKGNTLCLRVRMPHGHGPAGENPEEIHQFANALFKKSAPLAKFVKQGRDGQAAWATFQTVEGVDKAELNYTLASGKWQDRKWESIPAQYDPQTGKVTATIPDGATVYYFNLFDQRQCAVSAPHEELPQPAPK
jgi:dienelactone hydrolase